MMKLLMSWDIKPGKEDEYFEFIVQEFVPALIELGIQPNEAWYTLYGDVPQILAGWLAEDRETLKEVLESQEWKDIRAELLAYVEGFDRKIVPAEGMFQL